MAKYAGRMYDELKYEPYQITFADITPTRLALRIPGFNYEALSDDGYVYRGAYNDGQLKTN